MSVRVTCPRALDRDVRVVAVVSLLLAGVCPAFAGSVFMKNGYIIQGPVVERDDVSFVLGWQHGKMRIHRRFVEQVIYATGEEERLEELERLREEDALRAQIESASSVTTSDALPEDLDELLRRLNQPALGGLDGGIADAGTPTVVLPGTGSDLPSGGPESLTPEVVVSTVDADDPPELVKTPDEPDGAGTLATEMHLMTPPDQLLDGPTERSDGGLRIQRPSQWSVREDGALFELVSTSGESRSSLNLTEIERGDLELEEAFSLVRDRVPTLLEEVEVVSQGERLLGGEPALEWIVRGTRGEKKMQIRQVVAVKGSRLLIVSAFTDAQDQETLETIELCLDSVDFLDPLD